MPKPAMVVVGGLALVIGGLLGLFTRANQLIPWPTEDFTRFQVTGDPPVTVSDGSLHAHSKKKRWVSPDPDPHTIQPNPPGGQLYNDGTQCKKMMVSGKPVSAFFWRDDLNDDISPAPNTSLTILIVHDHANASDKKGVVTVSYPWDSVSKKYGPLTINDPVDFFGPDQGNGNRVHPRPGEVESITVMGSVTSIPTWTPANPDNPHFTIGFCYQ
jgi:hypothetical protein